MLGSFSRFTSQRHPIPALIAALMPPDPTPPPEPTASVGRLATPTSIAPAEGLRVHRRLVPVFGWIAGSGGAQQDMRQRLGRLPPRQYKRSATAATMAAPAWHTPPAERQAPRRRWWPPMPAGAGSPCGAEERPQQRPRAGAAEGPPARYCPYDWRRICWPALAAATSAAANSQASSCIDHRSKRMRRWQSKPRCRSPGGGGPVLVQYRGQAGEDRTAPDRGPAPAPALRPPWALFHRSTDRIESGRWP